MSYAIGDVVRLKSGGPQMTVIGKADEPEDYVDAIWFSESIEDREIHEASFPVEALKAVVQG